MWTREYLKTRAKAVLRVSYWKAFLVSIILGIAGANGGGGGGGGGGSGDYSGYSSSGEMIAAIIFILVVVAIVMALALAFRVFLGYPLEVGGRRFFVQNAQLEGMSSEELGVLGYAFNKERYMDIIKAMLYKGVMNFLWYLLLIIPGIVKKYSYMMVPYILSDNPNIGYKRALELSEQMTYGHKFNIFILELSFIGWYLLGLLACCIGIIFVTPYVDATMAELYLVLRRQAIEKNLCTCEELMLDSILHDDGISEY
ncbi:DUF975 family protein [Acetivibrio mesophilus]|uniref:DUF975 family protein n=1 Tax=Acetivibrio mesophilus TaxID=2487273 RepID=A0A4Q0I5B9_9FIRM|nr:DUF975 family protein [Acetivibrio mesophilus]ODM27827.1 hypothetical protein A7W90_17275 [Clostridium sp. Bc-iso-3]RXE59027.1 DUF975 family protein [Acetivibrio mesophilus]HHV30106.1 DUF975 family protein [Clostridium sp.]